MIESLQLGACEGKARLEVHLETSRKPVNIKVPLRGRLSRAPLPTVQKEQGPLWWRGEGWEREEALGRGGRRRVCSWEQADGF